MFFINTFVLVLLAALWTCYVQGYVLSSSSPVITPAPENYALIQERQNGAVTCSEWTFPNGGGYAQCPVASTCLFDFQGPWVGCGSESGDVTFAYSCYDYLSTPSTIVGPNDLICPASAPDCGTITFVSDGQNFLNLGCSTMAYYLTASWDGAAAESTTSSAAASTTPNPFYTVSTSTPTDTQLFGSSAAPSSPPTTSSPAASNSGTSPSKSNAAVIGGAVGGAVGGLAIIGAAILALICMRRRKRTRQTVQQPQAAAPAVQNYAPPDEKKQPIVTATAPQYTPPEEKPTKPYVSPNC